jgi:hypothetical protein
LPHGPPFVFLERLSDVFKDAGRTWRVMNPFAVEKYVVGTVVRHHGSFPWSPALAQVHLGLRTWLCRPTKCNDAIDAAQR